jgi:hypothetical protein
MSKKISSKAKGYTVICPDSQRQLQQWVQDVIDSFLQVILYQKIK